MSVKVYKFGVNNKEIESLINIQQEFNKLYLLLVYKKQINNSKLIELAKSIQVFIPTESIENIIFKLSVILFL